MPATQEPTAAMQSAAPARPFLAMALPSIQVITDEASPGMRIRIEVVEPPIVDVYIMLIMGVLGYALRKFAFDPAPLVLGLVIAPLFEQSLRQSLIMSNGDYLIFFSRPISLGLLIVCVIMLTLSAITFVLKRKDWRATLAEAEAGEVQQ